MLLLLLDELELIKADGAMAGNSMEKCAEELPFVALALDEKF